MKEVLIDLLTNNSINFTLEEIIKKLSLDKTQSKEPINNQVRLILKKLELEKKIYYDETKNRYYLFPSNFFIAKVKKIDQKNKILTINVNKKEVTITLPNNFKPQNYILIGLNKRKKYHYIKSLSEIKEQLSKDDIVIKNKILDMFYPLNKGISLSEFSKYLNTKNISHTEIYLKNTLQELEENDYIFFDNYYHLYFPLTNEYIKTEVNCSKKGLLYIKQNNQIIFLNPILSSDILPNDTVILKKVNKEYHLVKIVKRKNPNIVCEVTQKGIKAVGNKNLSIKMDKKKLKELSLPLGTRILGKIDTEATNHTFEVTYIETLGHKDDLNAEFDAIAYNNGFTTHYTKEELEQIKNMPTTVSETDKINRLDLTNETIFTIDGEHTKDFDDAISIKLLDNGNYELMVSIAHVHHYIKFNSPLWQRAEKNTTSLYMIENVSHMLHPQISNGICSLNPNVERLAKTFILEINKFGRIVDFKIANSIIKSAKKMTYEDVNKILEENTIPEGYEPFIGNLLKMHELSQILSKRHENDGAIDFGGKEIRFILDDDGIIKEIQTVKQGEAEKLIENFMIATNEAMAEYMLNLGLVFIYRNHEIPFDEKVFEATSIIKNLGYKIEKLKNANDPHLIQKIIQTLSTKEEFFILSSLLLKSMKKAYFSPENKGHYALALNAYSQTTSPIRRFLDLLIQYILDNLENLYDPNYDIDTLKDYITKMCEHASTMERNAEKCEYEANKLYMVNYCANHPEQEYVAYVSEITPNYLIIKTEELIEGIIYYEDLNDGNYIYNPHTKWLENKTTNERIIIGSKINIKLKDYNKEFRIIYFQGTTLAHENTLTRKKD